MSTKQENSIAAASQGMKRVHCTDHGNFMLKELRSYYENQELSDVVLIAGDDGQRVSAHRLVLSAASPYFKAMFTGSLREATEKEVTLNEVQGNILQALVEFCYSGHIDLHQDTAEMLLITASLFQMNSVVTECTKYLAEQLDSSNCLGMLSLADRHNCKELHKKAKDYIHKEFMEVCKNEEFLKLNATQLAEIIASDDLNVPSEEDVFNSIMEWMNTGDLSKREQHMRALLPLVRTTQLSPSFIFKRLEAVCRSYNCLDIFINALRWHNVPEERHETAHTKPRNLTCGTLLAVALSPTDDKIHIEQYCPRSNKWTVWNNAISYRKGFGVVAMDHNLLLVGGQTKSGEALNSVLNMNLTTLAETVLKPMNTPRWGLCVSVLENCLYAIGGYDGANILNTVERWDPVKDSWNYVAAMSTERQNAGAAVLNGCIYVAGGFSRNAICCTVECYNPLSNTWTERAPMCVARGALGMAVSKGVLYAVGGYTEGSLADIVAATAESYDPVTDKWTMIESMESVIYSVDCAFLNKYNVSCAFLGKYLMVVSGNEVEEYDPETKKWTHKGYLKERYNREAVCVVPKNVVLNLPHTFR